MKEYLLTILFFMTSLCGMSQKHMAFMGIPIDGDARLFRQKLVDTKGFTRESEDVTNGYCLIGKFYDEEANIQINYDPSNHIVYSVNVYIIKRSTLAVLTIQRDVLKAVEDKYRYEKRVIDSDLYQYDYYIMDGLEPIGIIQTFIVDSKTIPTTKEAMVTFTYVDGENYLNYESRKREDI
ncbi:MAG: hypothetical protein IJ570_08805 [Prevotella sp.]|nr:hypothetical protein [Prevotella sp.]